MRARAAPAGAVGALGRPHNDCSSSYLTIGGTRTIYGSSAVAGRGDLQSRIAPRNQTLRCRVSTHGLGSKENNHGKLRAYDHRPIDARARLDEPLLLHVLLTREAA